MKVFSCVLLTGLLAGCASSTPIYDAHFGAAVQRARLDMTLNPTPAAASLPVGTLEGKTAQEAAARYQASFKAPPPVVPVINIGGALSAGSQ